MLNHAAIKSIPAGCRCGLLSLLCMCFAFPAEAQPTDEPAAPAEDRQRHTDPDTEAPAEKPDPSGDENPNGGELEQPVRQMLELASAYRLRDELTALLTAEGRAAAGAQGGTTKLAGLATRCEVLANSAESDPARAMLLACQARANAALAEIEADGPDDARVLRLQKVRSAAEKIRALEMPGINSSADYWLLLADLSDAAHSDARVTSKQALAEQLMLGFLEQHAENPGAADYVIDTRLSLARLLDQSGDQAGVTEQLDAIGKLPSDSPRQAEIERLRTRVARTGKQVDFEGVTTRLDVWRLSDHLGQPVLIHIYADPVESSVAMISGIERAIKAQKLGGAVVVSLRVGEAVEGSPRALWPTLPTDLKPDGPLEQLGVDALPTLVWINSRGRIASIGNTLAVLQQMPSEAPEQEPDEPEVRDEAGEPGPNPVPEQPEPALESSINEGPDDASDATDPAVGVEENGFFD